MHKTSIQKKRDIFCECKENINDVSSDNLISLTDLKYKYSWIKKELLGSVNIRRAKLIVVNTSLVLIVYIKIKMGLLELTASIIIKSNYFDEETCEVNFI